jgi:hypothetical protein
METMLLSFVVFVLAALGLGVGMLVKGKPLKGHCGGGKNSCDCEKDEAKKYSKLERL